MSLLDALRTQYCDDLIRQAGYRGVAVAAICRTAVMAGDRHCDHAMPGFERRKHRLPDFPGATNAMQENEDRSLSPNVYRWGHGFVVHRRRALLEAIKESDADNSGHPRRLGNGIADPLLIDPIVFVHHIGSPNGRAPASVGGVYSCA